MQSIYRIEHSHGWGMFGGAGNDYLQNNYPDILSEINDFHSNYMTAVTYYREFTEKHFCAYCSIEDIIKAFTSNQILALIDCDFKIYQMCVENSILLAPLGNKTIYQVIFKKEYIITKDDITDEVYNLIIDKELKI